MVHRVMDLWVTIPRKAPLASPYSASASATASAHNRLSTCTKVQPDEASGLEYLFRLIYSHSCAYLYYSPFEAINQTIQDSEDRCFRHNLQILRNEVL